MAEKNKYRFKGHESFILREGWLNKGLTEVKSNPKVFTEFYGADALGVGPNMAKSIRYWLKTAGLTKDDKSIGGVCLTPLGELVYEKDPYIEDIFTLWLLHCQIVLQKENATAWDLFFNHFSYEEFRKSELMGEMKDLAIDVAEGGNLSEKSVEADCDAILHMYLPKQERNVNPEEKNVSPFAKLGLIKNSGETIMKKQPDLKIVPEDVVLYLLVCLAEKNKSIGIDELLVMSGGPGKVLHLKRTALMEKLEALECRGAIVMNRTAGLNMVYLPKELSALDVVKYYYR